MTLWCGNPSIAVPRDYHDPEQRSRFVHERQPAYFVETTRRRLRRHGPGFGLRVVMSNRYFSLLETVGIESAVEWRAPPPLACAGRPTSCLEGVGRAEAPVTSDGDR